MYQEWTCMNNIRMYLYNSGFLLLVIVGYSINSTINHYQPRIALYFWVSRRTWNWLLGVGLVTGPNVVSHMWPYIHCPWLGWYRLIPSRVKPKHATQRLRKGFQWPMIHTEAVTGSEVVLFLVRNRMVIVNHVNPLLLGFIQINQDQ